MKEVDLNRKIKEVFISMKSTVFTHVTTEGGWAYKIPDPSKYDVYTTSKRPFDGVAVRLNNVIFWEAKLVKGYQAFNFKNIKDHQIWNLSAIQNQIINDPKQANIFPILIIAIWESRKTYDLYIFHIDCIIKMIEVGDKSILKKDFERLRDDGKFYPLVRRKCYDMQDVLNAIVYSRDTVKKGTLNGENISKNMRILQ